jgi:hypothetical protein
MSYLASSVAADSRGLPNFWGGWLEGVLQMSNVLSSAAEARLPNVGRGGW